VTLIRIILLGVFGYLLYLRVRPYLNAKPELEGHKKPKPLPPKKEDRLDGKLPHEILGVERDADGDAVQKAYLKLVREHHPDRSATLSPAVQSEASDRTKAINWAYERLKKR
jgi:hypothetical protein